MDLTSNNKINHSTKADDMVDKFFTLFPVRNLKWRTSLTDYYRQDNWEVLEKLYNHLEPIKHKILPRPELVFTSLNYCDPDNTRVVILGQDPYPNTNHACGLAFSTANGAVPASLRNIFKEVSIDWGGEPRTNGDLRDWACQGVLLLNTILTVEEKSAGIHSKLGWQHVTEFILKTIWTKSPQAVFLLWGKHAQEAFSMPESDPRIFKCGHPSPLAYGKKTDNNFKGSHHFLKANLYLCSRGLLPITWNVP